MKFYQDKIKFEIFFYLKANKNIECVIIFHERSVNIISYLFPLDKQKEQKEQKN